MKLIKIVICDCIVLICIPNKIALNHYSVNGLQCYRAYAGPGYDGYCFLRAGQPWCDSKSYDPFANSGTIVTRADYCFVCACFLHCSDLWFSKKW